MIASPLLLILPLAAPQGRSAPDLQIDPLLLAEVVEVYGVIATADNPVWPGWDASDTPVLLYLPGVQDVLLNHPGPPAGFAPAHSPLLPPGWTMHLRDGETELTIDGQNTSRDVGGVETLVVADPLSNLRPQLVQLLSDPRPAREREAELDFERLRTDPYDQLAFVVHEAFHVHQFRSASGKAGDEMQLTRYPWLSAENNVGFALEGLALARALEAGELDAVYEAALDWLAVRLDRRARLTPSDVAYEDGTEFNEGLAKYTEWRLSQVLEGRPPGAAMRWARSFRGYDDLGFWREQLLQQMRSNLSGEVVVNNDPYGSGSLRFRLYFSGMALGALLDRLELEGWQERIFEPGTTLTGLVEELLLPTAEDLEASLERARSACDLEALRHEKRDLERRGLAAAQEAARRILEGGALFTLDYSALGDASVGWSMTPFGITRVDERRTIYGQVPVAARIGAQLELRQEAVSPALHDAGQHTIQFQLIEPVDAGRLGTLLGLERLGEEPLHEIDVLLPGVRVRAASGRFRVEAGGITLELLAG